MKRPWPSSGGLFDLPTAQARLTELNVLTTNPDLWNNPEKARKALQEKSCLEAQLAQHQQLTQRYQDALTLQSLAQAENDEATLQEAISELTLLTAEAERIETQCLLSGEADINNAFLEINAGAGGTESCDWAAMLQRMYTRWAEDQGFQVEVIDYHDGEQAGVKSATLKLSGAYAYGLSRTESGVHRLVRISPFDSNARRHTSFASVYVYPELDETITISINPADLRVDTYRSSGAGGQHVNKTDSAVRLTHLPTGIVVASQQDRSQHRNRDIALKMLQAKLYERERQKQQEQANKLAESKTDIGWGHQIRSYVLQPYQMVKDLRTGIETSNTTAVLNGDINAFIKAALANKV